MAIQEPPRRPPSGGGKAGNHGEASFEEEISKLVGFVNNIMQQERQWLRDWAITSKRIVELNSRNVEPKLLVTANFDTLEVILTIRNGTPDYSDACASATRTIRYEVNSSWGIKNSKIIGNKG